MSGTAALKNTMLDNWGITALSLHSAYSSSGSNELTGGSPAYARKTVTYSGATGGSKSTANQPVFDVPAGSTVAWIGKWAGATFAGMTPNSGAEKEFWVDVSTNIVTCYAHGYINTNTIVFFGDTVPGGLVEGTTYYVTNATTDTFTVAATSGGATIDLTSVPAAGCVVSKIVYEVYSIQATHTITSGVSNLNG